VETRVKVYTDFDGTVASCDVTDLVLQQLAPPEWEAIERQWVTGEIDAATCMRRQMRLLEADLPALDAILESVDLDPGFPDFVSWCDKNGAEIIVVSDGVDYFIRSVLTRHGFGRLPVFANKLSKRGAMFELEQPWRRIECTAGSGVCKCSVVAENPPADVYIGDGRSDECVGPTAELLFAKSKLADYCLKKDIPFVRFTTFADVQRSLAERASAAILLAQAQDNTDAMDSSLIGAMNEQD
jgi:2-hydroxy-3-keto-5-methylthiopentenyl-1-phosphate phosphatase